MIITAPDTERIVLEYDFNFTSGQYLGITVDAKYGDYVEEAGTLLRIHLGKKPSLANPKEDLAEEDIVINMPSLAFMAKRTKTLRDKTPEEEYEWKKVIAEVATKSVN